MGDELVELVRNETVKILGQVKLEGPTRANLELFLELLADLSGRSSAGGSQRDVYGPLFATIMATTLIHVAESFPLSPTAQKLAFCLAGFYLQGYPSYSKIQLLHRYHPKAFYEYLAGVLGLEPFVTKRVSKLYGGKYYGEVQHNRYTLAELLARLGGKKLTPSAE